MDRAAHPRQTLSYNPRPRRWSQHRLLRPPAGSERHCGYLSTGALRDPRLMAFDPFGITLYEKYLVIPNRIAKNQIRFHHEELAMTNVMTGEQSLKSVRITERLDVDKLVKIGATEITSDDAAKLKHRFLYTPAAFEVSYYDDIDRAALHLDKSKDHYLSVEIKNTSGQPITLTPFSSGKPSSSQHHFKLGFVPPAIHQKLELDSPGQWEFTSELDGQSNVHFIYFQRTTAKTLQPGETILLRLKYGYAEAQGNAKFAQVTSEVGANVNFVGNRPVQYRCSKHIALIYRDTHHPLAADFTGGRTVLNDGTTSNTLILQVTNLLPDSLKLNPQGSSPQTSLTISFDIAPDGAKTTAIYAGYLAKADKVNKTNVTIRCVKRNSGSQNWVDNSRWQKDPADNNAHQWTFNPTKSNFSQHESVFFEISGVQSDLAPGLTNLYLHYANLPHYSNNTLVAQIEKSPLIYGPNAKEGLKIRGGNGVSLSGFDTDYAHAALHVSVGACDKNSAHFVGGAGVFIDEVASGRYGLSVEMADDGGFSGRFKGGDGVKILGVKESKTALEVQGSNNGPTAKFSGGTGVSITDAGSDWSHPALKVDVGSEGRNSAQFVGGGGVHIKEIANGYCGLSVEMSGGNWP